VIAPEATPVTLRLPNGECRAFPGGAFSTEVNLA